MTFPDYMDEATKDFIDKLL